MKEIKLFVSPDGTREVRLYHRDDGHYSFSERYLETSDWTAMGWTAETFWVLGFESGIFADAETAERELMLATPWLQENSN